MIWHNSIPTEIDAKRCLGDNGGNDDDDNDDDDDDDLTMIVLKMKQAKKVPESIRARLFSFYVQKHG